MLKRRKKSLPLLSLSYEKLLSLSTHLPAINKKYHIFSSSFLSLVLGICYALNNFSLHYFNFKYISYSLLIQERCLPVVLAFWNELFLNHATIRFFALFLITFFYTMVISPMALFLFTWYSLDDTSALKSCYWISA